MPQLPPTHSFLVGAFVDCPAKGNLPGWPVVRWINNRINGFNSAISFISEYSVARKIVKLRTKGQDQVFGLADHLLDIPDPQFRPAGAVSQNYVTAGLMVPLFGSPRGIRYFGNPLDATDSFIQHHSQVYRELLEALLGKEHLPAGAGQTIGVLHPAG